jgi:NitT/TauT family transport system substrate-binding protein
VKKLGLLTAMAVVGLTMSGCGAAATGAAPSAGTGELQTVNVGQVKLPIFAPLYVAEAKGYFKDAGIKLNLETVKSGQDAIPLASSGKLDVVVAGFSAGMFSAMESGLDIKVVGSMGVSDGSEKTPTELVASKKLMDDGVVKSIADLRGKKIAAAGGAGGTGAFLLDLALRDAGLSIKDVNLVNLGNPDMPAALKNGSIDAALSSAPFSAQAIADGTGVSMAVPPKGTSGTGVIYGGKFAGSALSQKFFDALARGAKDLQGEARYSQDSLKIIGDATGQTAEQVAAVPLYTWLPNLAPLPDQLSGMEEVWMKAGAIKYSAPIAQDKYIDASFSSKAK